MAHTEQRLEIERKLDSDSSLRRAPRTETIQDQSLETLSFPVRGITRCDSLLSEVLVLGDHGQTKSTFPLQLHSVVGSGKRGVVYSGQLNGIPIAAKVYNTRKKIVQVASGLVHEARAEFDNNKAIRDDLPQYADILQKPLGVLRIPQLGEVFVSDLITDHDGRVSKSIQEQPPKDSGFIRRVREFVRDLGRVESLLRLTPGNILTHQREDGSIEPRVVDFQNYNSYRHYPLVAMRRLLGLEHSGLRTHRWFRRLSELWYD